MKYLEEMYEQPLPHSIEAEQAVLGAILLNENLDGAERLHPEHFYSEPHQIIFNSMKIIAERSLPIDLVCLTSQLQDTGVLQKIGNVSYLSRMSSAVPNTSSLGHYVNLVHDKALLRDTIRLTNQMAKMALKSDDPKELIANMQLAISDLADRSVQTKDFKSAKDVALNVFENVEHRYANYGDDVTGIPSGYVDLDKLTSGWQRSDLIIVAARPSVGKTAFALNIAQAAGIRHKKNVALISLEMSAEQLMQRVMSSEGNIHASRLRTGYMEADDWEKLTMAVGSIAQSDIFIDDSSRLTVRDIVTKCRRLHKSAGLDMIIIDYLQLIEGRNKKNENRQQEVSDISRSLKQLARELNIPVIALSQLSRGVEQRTDKRPMMSDLRESGAIEQDADIVAFLYRDDYYDKETENKNTIEIILAKQRNGPVGTVELAFMKQFNKFANLDRTIMNGSNGKQIPDMYRGR